MSNKKSYTGIDYVRFIAALLIIAIHTSPLASYSETGDFILTRIIARVAVPFFFMTSGFFLISKYTSGNDRLISFIKKTGLIYIVSILIYIPINVYAGYFKTDNLLPNIIKDIFFDGTMYHLWYLPAAMIGAAIAWYLVKHLDFKKALIISVLLYVIAILGDSYYGVTERIPLLNKVYAQMFLVSDYTRNGILFAPLFFVLGGFISSKKNVLSLKTSIVGATVSFALMLCEAMLLHHFELQKHDSMYIFLIPTMFFLFDLILHFKGKRVGFLRDSALIIYIIHPMMIVAVRFASDIVGLGRIFVANSLIHYITVTVASVVFAFIVMWLQNKFMPKKSHKHSNTDRGFIEVDLAALENNVTALQNASPRGCKLMAVLKAEAYGHGMYEVATHIESMGVDSFAVAMIDEGIQLREYGIKGEILILGYTSPERAWELKKYDLMQTLIDDEYARILDEQGYKVNCHIKIDTGMHRLGYDVNDIEKVRAVWSLKNINVRGVFTHLGVSDSLEGDDVDFTNGQIRAFNGLVDALENAGCKIPKVHIQSSYGLLNYPELKCDYVRIGIALCGVLSSLNSDTKTDIGLTPVLSLRSHIALIRDIPKGTSLGYGRAFTAKRDTKAAVVPIGYADGIPRNLSNGVGEVIINGQKAPIIGRICMDQLTVDVTDIKGAKFGGIVTFIGRDGDEEITAPEMAETAGTITNEILSRMGRRIKVVTVRNEK